MNDESLFLKHGVAIISSVENAKGLRNRFRLGMIALINCEATKLPLHIEYSMRVQLMIQTSCFSDRI